VYTNIQIRDDDDDDDDVSLLYIYENRSFKISRPDAKDVTPIAEAVTL